MADEHEPTSKETPDTSINETREEPEKLSLPDKIRHVWAETQAHWFSLLGVAIERDPVPFIAIPVLLFIAFGFGITGARLITDPLELWVQEGSRLQDEKEFQEAWFRGLGDAVAFHALPRQAGANMMDQEYINEAYIIDGELLDMRAHRNEKFEFIGECYKVTTEAECDSRAYPMCGWDSDLGECIFMDGFGLFPSYMQKKAITVNHLGVEWGWREICSEVRVPTPSGTVQESELSAARTPCSQQFTPQDCFAEHPYTQQSKTLDILGWSGNHPYSANDTANRPYVMGQPCKMWQGSYNGKGYTLGGVEYEETGVNATKIAALKFLYPHYEKNGFADKYNNYIMKHENSGIIFRMLGYPETISPDQADDIIELWQEKVHEHFEEFADTLAYSDVSWLTSYQVDKATKNAATGNQAYVIIGLCLLLVVVWIFLFRLNPVSSRLLLGLFGVLLVALAVWGAMGFATLIGMSFNGMSLQVLPYVSMGLGIDNMFIILHYFPEEPQEPLGSRMEKCYGHAGPSITATSIINTIVFFVGASIPITAVRDFAIQAGICVIFNYTVMCFTFGAFLVYDARRIQKNACDVFVCCPSKTPYKAPRLSYTHTVVEILMRPITSNVPVQIVLMLCTFGLLGVSIWVDTDLDLGLPFSEFINDNGIEGDYLRIRTQYFLTEGNNVLGDSEGTDWSKRENQINLYNLVGHYLNNPENPWAPSIQGRITTGAKTYLVGGPSWVTNFRTYALQWPGAQAPENDPCLCFPNIQLSATVGRYALYNQIGIVTTIPTNCTVREDMFYDLLLLFAAEKTFLEDGVITDPAELVDIHDQKYFPQCGNASHAWYDNTPPTIRQVESSLVPITPAADEVVYTKGSKFILPLASRWTTCTSCCPATTVTISITKNFEPGKDILGCGACSSAAFTTNINASATSVTGSLTFTVKGGANLSMDHVLWQSAIVSTYFISLSDRNKNKTIEYSFTLANPLGGCATAGNYVYAVANKLFMDPTGGQFGYGVMAPYTDQLAFENGKLRAWQISVLNSPVEQSNVPLTLDMMSENRKFLDDYPLDVFATGQSYILAEQYRFSHQNTRNLIVICLCCSLICMSVLMASVQLALIQTIVIGMSMIVICASLEVLDLQLNGISMMSILFGIGLNVELCVHICRAFLVVRPALPNVSRIEQNRDRVSFALSEMSVPVFDGAFTSFMGVVVLAFANIGFFRKYFFQFYSLMIVISLWHAFVPLPILLCYFGPSALPPKVLGDEEMEEARSKAASEAAEEEARERELAKHEP